MSSAHPQGWICEIFASIQGEGIYCGQSQTFVRLAGCNLACSYCDTPKSRHPQPESCRLDETSELNPLSVEGVAGVCSRLGRRVVSLTGGEPLMQVDYLSALMRELRERDMTSYLETNGTLHDRLPLVIDTADCIAMDIKLPSATGQPPRWEAHAQFLQIAIATEVFVKAVVTDTTPDDEIMQSAELVASVNKSVPLVIQPAHSSSIAATRLIEMQEIATRSLDDVRVIPQCHKTLGLR